MQTNTLAHTLPRAVARATRLAVVAAAAAALSLPLVASPLAAQQGGTTTPRKRPAAAKAPAKPAGKTQSAPATPRPPSGRIVGVLEDSIHMGALIGATVRVDGAGRGAVSDDLGRFSLDGVPPGEHQLVVTHPLLDSLYVTLVAPGVRVAADSVADVTLTTPSLASLLGGDCPPATRTLGPAVFAGRVMEADTKAPAAGVRVVLVWMQISAGTDIGVRPMPRVRTATSDARGFYRICGIPGGLEDATIQAERGRVKTAEVPVAVGESGLGLRSFLVRPAGDSATRGRAVVTGHVVDTLGAPVERAQVSVEGASAVAMTNARGDFTLDSLPSGTEAVVVRRLGFAPSRTVVDLSAEAPVRVAVKLGRAVPRLNTVVVTAQSEALSRVGFEERQKRGLGHFIGPDQIARMQPQQATSVLRMVPGLRVVPTGGGTNTVQSSRDARGGCVTYWVDGAPFQEMQAGDLDASFPASQIAAVETYQPNEVPGQFSSAGQGSCTTVVIWTQASIRRRNR